MSMARHSTTPPYLRAGSLSDITSDSDDSDDPNVEETEVRPPRGASIRARVVIANACGVKDKARSRETRSPKYVKEDRVDDAMVLSVDDFLMDLEEDLGLSHVVKVETKPTVIKKLEDDSSSINETSSSSGLDTPSSDSAPSPAPMSASARKRPREVFDCVLLTSRKTMPKRQRTHSPEVTIMDIEDLSELDSTENLDDDESFKKKMKSWKNDKVKKNEDLRLLPETLRARIRPIGFDVQDQYITVDKLTREHLVTRQFMSQTYGGSSQGVEPTIGADHRVDHDMTDFFYMNTEFQPEAPEVPGAPGLFFCTGPGSDLGVKRMITKIKDSTAKNDNKWLYVGQYDLRSANPPYLTVAEWRAQPDTFHNKWARAIVSTDWGVGLCIRLHARKLYNRNPTREDWKHIAQTGGYKSITEEEVKEAYFSGQERMGVWTVKCVGYDNAFQQEISEKFTPGWVPMTPEERKIWRMGQREKRRLRDKEEKKVKRLKKEEEQKLKLEFD